MNIKTCAICLLFASFCVNFASAKTGPNCTSNGDGYTICASSVLSSSKRYSYGVDNFNTPGAAWCEGSLSSGEGQSITINFPSRKILRGIEIENGYNRTRDTYRKNSRAKAISISSNTGHLLNATLHDISKAQTISVPAYRYQWIKITVKSIYHGSKYSDMCITSVWPNLSDE